MKSISLHYSLALILILFMGCEKYSIPTFQQKDAFIQVQDTALTIDEKLGNDFFVTCLLAAAPQQDDLDITFQITQDQYGESAAIEGEDYIIVYPASKNLRIPKGRNTASVTIKVIDNNEFSEDKYFNIELVENSKGLPMNIDLKNKTKVTIRDDEHPLALILGDFSKTDTVLEDGSAKTPYPVSINPIVGSTSEVMITNFWNYPDHEIRATVDIKNRTILILPNQVIHKHETEGDVFCVRYDLNSNTFDYINPVQGLIDDSGNITLEAWGPAVENGYFEIFNSSFLDKK